MSILDPDDLKANTGSISQELCDLKQVQNLSVLTIFTSLGSYAD